MRSLCALAPDPHRPAAAAPGRAVARGRGAIRHL